MSHDEKNCLLIFGITESCHFIAGNLSPSVKMKMIAILFDRPRFSYAQRHFAERLLTERHFDDSNFADIHIAGSHIARSHLDKKTIGQFNQA